MKRSIQRLESVVEDPSKGLPEDVFLFISRITPMINVDLLIRNEKQHTLLTWRDDGYWAPGWHIPGGIVRFKELISDRLNAVAACELRAGIAFKNEPLAINEVIHPSRKNRGHFISLLYECVLTSALDGKLRYHKGIPKPGEWAWHKKCPENIIAVHEMYRPYIGCQAAHRVARGRRKAINL